MEIGQVIKKYRQQLHLTQEEVARRLNVSPPAVNKWEKGVTLPDIALLPPLARLLGISCDELLTYKEALTEGEINAILQQARDRLAAGEANPENFAAVVQWAKEQLAEYPNCQLLAQLLAQLLEGWRVAQLADAEEYDDWLRGCFQRLLESPSEEIRTAAAESLFNLYLRREEYAQAEACLSYFPAQNPERGEMQALIYSRTGRTQQAWQAYEELLFAAGNRLSLLLHRLYTLAVQEDNAPKAKSLLDKQAPLARLLEMGPWHELSGQLDYALWQQEPAAALAAMEGLLHSCADLCAYIDSPLYEHMNFQRPGPEFTASLRQKLLTCFRDEAAYEFMQNDPAAWAKWRRLIK